MENNMRGKILETETQRAICDYLAYRGFFFWRNNNTPVYDPVGRKFRAKPKYTPKGLPDIICIKCGHFIGLEVKRIGFKQTQAQKLMQNNIEENGGYYYLVYSVEDLRKIDFFK